MFAGGSELLLRLTLFVALCQPVVPVVKKGSYASVLWKLFRLAFDQLQDEESPAKLRVQAFGICFYASRVAARDE